MSSDLIIFNPIELSRETEKIVIIGNKRKYNGFRLEHFYGQIATARGVGCNLRCYFCWINLSRDSPEKYGKFYSPEEVYHKLMEVSSSEYGEWSRTYYLRISGCEPTIGKEHLLSLIELCVANQKPKFLLETNGLLLGNDESYVKDLSLFKRHLLVRLSFKAGSPKAFGKKTKAKSEFFELPFMALMLFKKYKIDYRLASMSLDPKIMPPAERRNLLKRLINAGVKNLDLLEEEKPDLFGITKRRLESNNLDNFGNFVYEPLSDTLLRCLAFEKGFNGLEDERLLKQGGVLSLVNELKRYKSRTKLTKIISNAKFKIQKSPCKNCQLQNAWHGHGVEDDLNEVKLGKFVH